MTHGTRKNQTKKFTFTVEGRKYKFDTVQEMWEGIHSLRNKGIRVDQHSIKIEYIELPKTLTSLVKFVSNDIDNKEDLQEDLFVELVSCDTMEVVKEFSKGVQLSKKDFDIFTSVYGVYNYCTNIEEVKFNLLIDVISEKLEGNKITYSAFKKNQIKKSL